MIMNIIKRRNELYVSFVASFKAQLTANLCLVAEGSLIYEMCVWHYFTFEIFFKKLRD